jgi:Mrp family chromosome partitioning ATPase
MARIREKLRHGGAPAAIAPAPVDVPDENVEAEVSDSMSFIEVGPRRYFEASADVLAAGPHSALLRSLPVAAPKRGLAPELVAYHAPGQPSSARYGDLLASLLEAGRVRAGVACRTLLLTAARAEIGTTTVLLNLAISAARQDRRVVVVDANLRRPAVADRLALSPGPGLTDVLAGEVALEDAVRATAQDNLFVLTAGSPASLLADETCLRDVVLGLAAEYDLVLIDGPRIEQPLPVAGRAWDRRAVSLLATACQAMYLVVPASESESASTTELVAGLAARALPLAGCIVAA